MRRSASAVTGAHSGQMAIRSASLISSGIHGIDSLGAFVHLIHRYNSKLKITAIKLENLQNAINSQIAKHFAIKRFDL